MKRWVDDCGHRLHVEISLQKISNLRHRLSWAPDQVCVLEFEHLKVSLLLEPSQSSP